MNIYKPVFLPKMINHNKSNEENLNMFYKKWLKRKK